MTAHVHGVRVPQPAWWVLLTAGEPLSRALVVPGEMIRGLTFSLVGEGDHARSRVAGRVGAWGQLRRGMAA